YRVSATFPGHERFGLAQELRKTVRSVAANIAEGNRRKSLKEYLRHLDIANGSVAELETQLMIGRELGYLPNDELLERLSEVDALLAGLIRALRWREKQEAKN